MTEKSNIDSQLGDLRLMQASRRPRLPTTDAQVRERFSVLELAVQLGNITEACRRSGMDRASFYQWRHRFQALGIAGLQDIHKLPCRDPDAIHALLQERICVLALACAANTGARIEAILMLEGSFVAASAVECILTRHHLGTPEDRWLRLEQQARRDPASLTAAQVALIEKYNPCYRERANAGSAPGSLLVQDTVFAFVVSGRRVYLHVVIDTFAAFAFGALHTSRDPECAASVLENRVFPFFSKFGRRATAIATDRSHEFCGGACNFKALLDRHGIAHVLPLRGKARANGFIERFCRDFMEGFVRKANAETSSLEALQLRCDAWLRRYNNEVPHLGYPNHGHTPSAATSTSGAETIVRSRSFWNQ